MPPLRRKPWGAAVVERPDDLAQIVDAEGVGVASQGIVDRGEDIDWHVVALLTA